MARNDLGRIKGTTFTPQVNKGILSFTNDNNEENPAPVRVQGVSYIPHLNDKVLSFTNDGGLENPQTVDLNTIDRNLNTRFYDWFGTQKEYDEMKLRDTETRYNLYDESTGDTSLKFFRAKHPTSYYDERITRVIQADNKKLTSWDKYGDMPIKRQGNKPLDDYIVAQGDWGTIYSDGVVTVERLAPTTNEDYQLTLAQLEEIQNNNTMLLNDEGYTPFDFNSLADHKTLINDINNSNIKTIDSTVYPITYTDSTTGEVISIEKPVLKQGEIPTPISFGCLVTKDNEIYTGERYENYGKSVKNAVSGLTQIFISKKNNISKYQITGTTKYNYAIMGVTLSNDVSDSREFECIKLKARVSYKGDYTPITRVLGLSGMVSYKEKITDLGGGWYECTSTVQWNKETKTRIIGISCEKILAGIVINDGELFVEIDDNSFMYTAGQVELPTIPQGMIVPNCNLEFSVPVDVIKNSVVVKGIEHVKSSSRTESWVWQSQDSLIALEKTQNISLYSNTYVNGSKYNNESYSDNFKIGGTANIAFERDINIFKQLLIYKGDLTQSELEAERDKFLKMNNKYNNE